MALSVRRVEKNKSHVYYIKGLDTGVEWSEAMLKLRFDGRFDIGRPSGGVECCCKIGGGTGI